MEVTLPYGTIIYVQPTDNKDVTWGPRGVDIPDLDNIELISDAEADFEGASNTNKIVNSLGDYNDGDYAANLCAILSNETGCDWYLPALGKLNAIYQQ